MSLWSASLAIFRRFVRSEGVRSDICCFPICLGRGRWCHRSRWCGHRMWRCGVRKGFRSTKMYRVRWRRGRTRTQPRLNVTHPHGLHHRVKPASARPRSIQGQRLSWTSSLCWLGISCASGRPGGRSRVILCGRTWIPLHPARGWCPRTP